MFIEPLDTLAVLPQAIFYALFSAVNVRSEPVLLAFVPPALILAAIRPVVDTISLLLVCKVLAIVAHAV